MVNPVTFDYVAWPVGYIVSLYNSGVGALQIGIRAGLHVGNPFYWSMLSLELIKIIYELKMSCENPLRILFTPYPTRSTLSYFTSICFNVVSKFRFSGLGSYRPVYVSSPLLLFATAALTWCHTWLFCSISSVLVPS